MKNLILLTLISILSPMISQTQNYYDISYDFGHFDHPTAFVADDLENIIICGWQEDFDSESQTAFALKVDNFGQEIWRVTLDTLSKFYALCLMENGNIALAGSINNNCFLKVISGENGNEVWSYMENGSSEYWFGTINELYNGTDYVLQSVMTNENLHLPIVFSFDSESGLILQQYPNYMQVENSIYYSFQETPDIFWYGTTYLAKQTDYYGQNITLWTWYSLHIAGMDQFLPDEGCIVRFLWLPDNYHIGLLTWKLDWSSSSGNSIKLYGDDIEVVGSGVLGYEKILATGRKGKDLALWLIGNDLDLIDEIVYTNENRRTGIDVLGLNTNSIVIMGFESNDDGYTTDVFLMKRNPEGTVSTNEIVDQSNIQIYPNPVTDQIYIKNLSNLNVEIDILDNLGNLIMHINQTNQFVPIESIPPGYYVALIKINKVYSISQKLIIQ